MTFRFLQPAEAELLDGISYYSAIRPELGIRFEQAVAEAVSNAVAHPERGAPRIYRADESGVLIIAVTHQRKKPKYWADRLE